MIKDLDVKFESVQSLAAGGFREPELKATLESCDAGHILDQIGLSDIIEHMGISETIEYLQDNEHLEQSREGES